MYAFGKNHNRTQKIDGVNKMLHSKVLVGRTPEELEERMNHFFEENGVGSNSIITLKFSTFVASKADEHYSVLIVFDNSLTKTVL
ncbi:conserved hypothetical protein [Exiguobacterium oxidotolerans]|uniref:Uncharacterized protein n=2 Tax=Bacillales Family XII. Incertae Sedis TaxID=539742 RepID=A0A653I6F6_9BACL|nr:conserved hypothetical protein [Exiguobacterium oxidotolerans]